jgi:hypothetical protein
MSDSGLISFLVTGNPFPDKELAEVRGEISFSEAINGHIAWRRCLVETALGHTERPMNCLEVCDENGCLLGRWLNGAGQKRYGDLPSFVQLREQHARFHLLACEILERSSSKRLAEAQCLMEGEFLKVSTEIIDRMKHLHTLFRG